MLSTVEETGVRALAKANGVLVTAGKGLGLAGQQRVQGKYSSLRYLREPGLLCAGDTNGTLSLINLA